MDDSKKTILIVFTKAPYGSSTFQEALDIVLAAGTFDQHVSLLLSGDACYQLLPDQQPDAIHQKNTSKMMNALPIYGIDNIFVDTKEAMIRGVDESATTTLPVQFINHPEIQELYIRADTVLRF